MSQLNLLSEMRLTALDWQSGCLLAESKCLGAFCLKMHTAKSVRPRSPMFHFPLLLAFQAHSPSRIKMSARRRSYHWKANDFPNLLCCKAIRQCGVLAWKGANESTKLLPWRHDLSEFYERGLEKGGFSKLNLRKVRRRPGGGGVDEH